MKNHRNTQLLWTAGLLAIVLLAPLPAHAAGARLERQVAATSSGLGGIQWSSQVPNDGFTLTVTGDLGEVNIQRTFKSGASLRFQPNGLPDGVYRWELTVIAPEVTGTDDGTNGRDPKLVKQLSKSSSWAFGSPRRRLLPPTSVSGTFTIRFGGMVDANRREQEPSNDGGQ